MLKRLYEWYRIVTPSPSNELVENRKSAVDALLSQLHGAEDYNLVRDFVVSAVNGVAGHFPGRDKVVEAVVTAIRNKQPAFPEDVTENALEVRACCMIAIGEILVNPERGGNRDAELAASILVSALPMLGTIREHHLRAVAQELYAAALNALDLAGKRVRSSASHATIAATPAPAELTKLATSVTDLANQFQAAFEILAHQYVTVREESDVLWWMFSGHSFHADLPLSKLDTGAACLAAGVELADRVLLPPTNSIRPIVQRAVSTLRSRNSAKTTESLITSWPEPLIKALVPHDDSCRSAVRQFPSLMPLSWAAMRLTESGGSGDSLTEYERLTGHSIQLSRSAEDWAVQIFNERVCQRVYTDLIGG